MKQMSPTVPSARKGLGVVPPVVKGFQHRPEKNPRCETEINAVLFDIDLPFGFIPFNHVYTIVSQEWAGINSPKIPLCVSCDIKKVQPAAKTMMALQ